jgi:hypothetical protein
MSVALGIVTALFLPLLIIPFAMVGVGLVSVGAAVAYFVGLPAWAIILLRRETREQRGWGIGLLIGRGVFTVVGGGPCIALRSQL